MKFRFGLRAKFTLLIVFGLTLIFVAIAAVTIRITTQNLRTTLVNESKAFATFATKPIGETYNIYKDSGTFHIGQQVNTFTDLNDSIDDVQVVDVGGNQLLHQGQGKAASVSQAQAASFEPVYVYDGGKLVRIVYPYIEDFGAHRYTVVYNLTYDTINRSIRQLTTGILILAALALLISIVATYFVIYKLFLKPLGVVSMAALAISQGDLDRKIEQGRNDEIGDLSTSVNTMADSLKADIQKLKEVDAIKSEFMMIASHNLRTPLTIIQGYLDTLLLNKELPEAVRGTVEVVAASGNRLNVFAEDILTVSRLEAGESDVMGQRERTDLTELLNQIAKDFTPLAKEKKLEFQVLLPDHPCYTVISKPHIRAAFWNLLDNALKFTKQGSITLKLDIESGRALVSVSDTGDGIAPDEVPKLFTKFHRGTSTLNYDYEGTGLGLYLTKLIIDQHSGSIAVDSQLGKGTTLLVTLPLQLEAQAAEATPNNRDK